MSPSKRDISRLILLGSICLLPYLTLAQSAFSANGYVKNMFSAFKPYKGEWILDNLVHQRTNVYWNSKSAWSGKASLRTRFFYGKTTEQVPNFGEVIDDGANDLLNLSIGFDVGDKGYIHTYFDRLYVEYAKDNLELRLGRQRVNWGKHLIWNPNDLFNAYNYADFDYEERAGADAFTARYYYSPLSDVEFAVRAFKEWKDATIAFAWRTNKGLYDFQNIVAYHEQQFVFGNAWAGNLGQWSFKGEWSVFVPLVDSIEFGSNVAIGFEYITKGGVSMNFSALYNADGKTDGSLAELFIFEPSARNLYPYKWAIFTSAGFQFHPLFYGNLAIIYSPVPVHPLFFNPALTWSATTNLDIDAVLQFAFNKFGDQYISAVQGYFLRVKWSF